MATFLYPPLAVSVSVPPTGFTLNGVNQVVQEDDVLIVNNHPMPSGLMIKNETGQWVPVTLDQTAPYANTPIPVCLTDITGSVVVNVTASGLNVKIVHNGVDPSSIRLGDGITEVGVTLNNQLKVNHVHDGTTPSSTQIGDGTTLTGVTLNNQLKTNIVHNTTTPSSVRLGDGTTEVGVVAATNELKISDATLAISPSAPIGTNKGPMVQGLATTAAPAYTTAQINPLSLDLTGNLRVIDSSASTSKLSLSLINGDVGVQAIDDITGVTLTTPAVGFKQVRLVQNGGGDLYIFRGAVKIGALEKGGVFTFNQTFSGAEALILKNVAVGTVNTNISWNIFA